MKRSFNFSVKLNDCISENNKANGNCRSSTNILGRLEWNDFYPEITKVTNKFFCHVQLEKVTEYGKRHFGIENKIQHYNMPNILHTMINDTPLQWTGDAKLFPFVRLSKAQFFFAKFISIQTRTTCSLIVFIWWPAYAGVVVRHAFEAVVYHENNLT